MAEVGKSTGKTTQAGREVYETPSGEMVSEKSTTFKYKGQWINVPTIHKGYAYDQDILRIMLDAEVIEPTSAHKSKTDAVKAAKERSETLKFNEGGDVKALGDLEFEATPMQEALSRRPGFKGAGALDFGGFSEYLQDNVSKDEIKDGLNFAGEWMVPFYDAGSKMSNVISEYSKPEDERNYDLIKEELNKAGTSAGTEAAMWIMGGAVAKYGGKAVSALTNKAKQYELNSNTTSAFGAGAIQKKADEAILPPPENAARTQIAGTLPTYKKADTLLTEIAGEGKTLDFGAGLGLSKKELGFDTYEPFPKGDFTPDFTKPETIPSSSYKKITNLNVLNVVPREVRDSIVKDIGRILEPNGTAIITTRGRDVMAAKGKAGPEPMSIITSKDTYQKGFTQPELREYISETLGDGFTIINNKLGAAGVTVQKAAAKNFNEGGMAMDDQMEVMFKSSRTGYALGGEVEAIDPVSGNEIPPGSSAKEVRDDIPAMLSEGEYVVPADVTRYYGVKFFEDLRSNAKVDLAEMEDNGRIGGEPVPEGDDDLTADEMALLEEVMTEEDPIQMAEGGMVGQQMAPTDPYQQQAMMYKEPIRAAAGTLAQSLDAFGNPLAVPGLTQPSLPDVSPSMTTNQPIYGVNTSTNDAATTLVSRPAADVSVGSGDGTSTGMKTVFYIHKDGRRLSILMSNGKPISSVPADFSEFLEDTPANRETINFVLRTSGSDEEGEPAVSTEGATVRSDNDNDNDSDDFIVGTQGTSSDPKGEVEVEDLYKSSGVNMSDQLKGATDALGDTFKVSKGFGTLLSAIPGVGLPLSIGAGLVGGASGAKAVAEARANQQMATFLGDTKTADAIDVKIKSFLADQPGITNNLSKHFADGDAKYNDAIKAAFNVDAPEEATIYYDKLSEAGKDNVNAHILKDLPKGSTISDDGSTITYGSTDVTTSLRPKARPSSVISTKTDPISAPVKDEPKGLYESITSTKFKNTATGKALGLGSSSKVITSIANKPTASTNPTTVASSNVVNKTSSPVIKSDQSRYGDPGAGFEWGVQPGTNAITKIKTSKPAATVVSQPVNQPSNNNSSTTTSSTTASSAPKTSWSDSGWNPKNWF